MDYLESTGKPFPGRCLQKILLRWLDMVQLRRQELVWADFPIPKSLVLFGFNECFLVDIVCSAFQIKVKPRCPKARALAFF